MVNSIDKGKRFERDMAKLLTQLTGVKWMRVPNSGGIHNTNNYRFKGDLFSDHPSYQNIVVECKIRKKPITLFDIMSPTSIIYKWIQQVQSYSPNGTWLLFFKSNYSPIFVAGNDISLVSSISDNVLYYENYLFGQIKEVEGG